MHRCRPGGGHRAASWHPTIDKKVQRYALEQRILQMRKENEQLEKENVRLAAINLGFPRFGGQVDKGNAMTTRLLIDERPKPCTPAVHTAAEGGSPRVPWAAPDPAPRRTRGDAVWQIVRDPWRCGNHSGSPGSPLTAATTGDSAHLGACVLPAGPARRRLDQQWQRGRPTDGSRPDKTGISMAAPAALCLTFSRPCAISRATGVSS